MCENMGEFLERPLPGWLSRFASLSIFEVKFSKWVERCKYTTLRGQLSGQLTASSRKAKVDQCLILFNENFNTFAFYFIWLPIFSNTAWTASFKTFLVFGILLTVYSTIKSIIYNNIFLVITCPYRKKKLLTYLIRNTRPLSQSIIQIR